MAAMSDRPTSAVSSAAVRGTQTWWRLRSAKPAVSARPASLAGRSAPSGCPASFAGSSAPLRCPASSLSLISAALSSGPRSRCASVVIALPRVLFSRYLPSLGKGPRRTDKVSDRLRMSPTSLLPLPPANPVNPSPGSDLPIRRPRKRFSSSSTADVDYGLSSAPAVDQAHRLGAGDVVPERPAHRRGHGPRARLAHASHRHAQVLGLDDHHDAARVQDIHQCVRYLAGHPLLHLRPLGVDVYQPGQLGEPGDLALLVRHVAD